MTRFSVSSLRVRLLLLALLTLAPIFGLFVNMALEHRRLAAAEAQRGVLRLARFASIEQEQLLRGTRQLLIGLAHLPEVENLDSPRCSALFSNILKEFPEFTNLAAVRPNGEVFCSGLPLPGPLNVADQPHIQGALRTRDFAIGPYRVGPVTGRPVVTVGYPDLDAGGAVRAVVTAAIDLAWINRLAAETPLPQGSVLVVIDRTGRILARHPDPDKWVGKFALEAAIVKTVLAQHEGVAEGLGLEGMPRLFGFTSLRGGLETENAHVWVSIPQAVAFAEANRLFTRNAIVLGLVAALALVLGWVGSHVFIRRPVDTLVSASERLGAGDLSTRVGPPYGRGELGHLARAFDLMAADLTERSAELQEAETKYRVLVEQSLSGVYLVTRDRFFYINQAMAAIFGYEVDEVIGRLGPTDLVHPDDRSLMVENLRARLSGEVEALRYTFRGLRKDGATVHCEVFGRRILYQGKSAILGTLIDITERSRVTRALRVLSGCNQALIHATAEPELLHHICRVIVEVGGYRLAWVGFAERDEAKTVRPVASAGYEAGYLESLRITWADTEQGRGPTGTAVRAGKPSVARNTLTDPKYSPWRAEATKRGYASAIALPLIAGTQPFGALNIYAEEPDAFDAEEVKLLTELADDLVYGIVALRTLVERKRAEEQLQHQREASYQNEKLAAMGQLLAGVAHELNNPLSVIIGHTAILRQIVGGPFAERAEKMTKAAERCARIVKNFLALARQQPPERSRMELNRVVREAVELLAYPLRVDNVEVTLNLADDLPTLWVDPHQLHQVVVNLVSNAHHVMRETPSPRRLTLATRHDPRGGWVQLEVADTGPGIPPEIQRRIFEPFFTTKPVGQGTGLGLSLCQGIVESHGGLIRVESQPGQGAIFVVELPAEAPPVTESETPESEAAPPVRGKTILVVDDEPEVAGVLAELLSAEGHQVETAANGVQALDKLRERAYDLILIDLRMPELDGPGLYRELERRDPRLLRRVVFLTGDTLRSESREFLERAAAPSLTKPFDMDEVRRVVQQVLRSVERGTT